MRREIYGKFNATKETMEASRASEGDFISIPPIVFVPRKSVVIININDHDPPPHLTYKEIISRLLTAKVCECGVDKTGGIHSSWCPKATP